MSAGLMINMLVHIQNTLGHFDAHALYDCVMYVSVSAVCTLLVVGVSWS